MEGYLVDSISSGVVVLDWLLTANIPDFDDFVRGSTGDAGAIWVEFDGSDSLAVIVEGVDYAFGGAIPQFHGCVFRARCNQARVWGELCRVDPVGVRADGKHEAAVCKLENLQVLIIRARKEEGTVIGK